MDVRDGNSRLVWSSEGGRVRDAAEVPAWKPAPGSRAAAASPQDGFVRIRREKQGRGGNVVTTITGVPGSDDDLDALLKVLKRHCGAGGSRAVRTLEIQGDHRAKLQAKLEALGHRVKLAGG